MSVYAGPNLPISGLVLNLDASNPKSYPGTGTSWINLSAAGSTATKGGSQSPTYPLYNAGGWFTFTGGVNGDNYSRFTIATPLMSAITVIAFHRPTASGGHILRHSAEAFQLGPDGFCAGTNYNNINYGYNLTANLNTWRCHALTFTGTDLTAYQNAVQVGTASRALTTLAAGILHIGTRSDDYAAHYVGDIASIQIYNRTLSADEIQQNFNANRGRFGI